MKNCLLFLLLSLVFAMTAQARAQDADDDDDAIRPAKPSFMKSTQKPAGAPFACPYEENFQQPRKIGAYTLRLLPIKKEEDDKDEDRDSRCRAVLTSAGGRKITIAEGWALRVDNISGDDLNGDGKPEIILDGYTGGLQCCYTYVVVSLAHNPQVLRKFHNQLPVSFEKQADGTALIHAPDGVFDYFLVPHSDAVIPQLILKMEGSNLVDVSARFAERYDKQIDQARSQLTPADLEQFHKSNYSDRLFMDRVPTVRRVLTIVLNYLYSGREEKAWETLNELWPAADVRRVKSLILERRARGLLAEFVKDAPEPAQQARSTP
jgi:hypothetical protein